MGQVVANYPTSAAALRHAGLDYSVEKRPLFTGNPGLAVPDYFATVRTDTDSVLGVVGRDYAIVQNIDAFSFFDAIVGGDGMLYETAGALEKASVFLSPQNCPGISGSAGRTCSNNTFFSPLHMTAFTPICIVCNNTLNAALHNHHQAIKIRHTVNAKDRLEQAHRLMGITDLLGAELEMVFNHWAGIRITDTEIEKLIQLALVPNKEVLQNFRAGKEAELSACFRNRSEAAVEYALTNDSQQLVTSKGTLFGAYNAVTGYFQNVRQYKDEAAKLKSILLGGTAQIRAQKAFRLCEQFANGAPVFYN